MGESPAIEHAMKFGFGDFLLRTVFATVLVMATWNPSGWSYADWVWPGLQPDMALKALAGVVLLIGYVICLRATLRSIGIIGAALVAALLGALGWVLVEHGILSVANPGVLQWLLLAGAGLVLGIGLSWSHVRRAISGQADMDDVDE